MVAEPAACERDVEQLPACLLGVDERVRGIHARSLSAVNGGGVAEFKFFTHILCGQHECLAVGLVTATQPAHGERTVVVAVFDLPAVAVLDPAASGGEAALVEAGDDEIADACGGAVVQALAVCFNLAGFDEVGAGAFVEVGDHLAGSRDHQRAQALVAVGTPCLIDAVEHGLGVALDESALLVIGVERISPPVAEAEAGGLLPLIGEAAHIGQFRNLVAVPHEHPERPTRLHGGQLRPVSDQDDLGTGLGGVRGDAVEREGSRERGLVHEHELPGLEVPASFRVFVEELRGVLRPHTERVTEDFGGCRRGRETDHGVLPVCGCPCPVQGAQRGGLAGTGWADE